MNQLAAREGRAARGVERRVVSPRCRVVKGLDDRKESHDERACLSFLR